MIYSRLLEKEHHNAYETDDVISLGCLVLWTTTAAVASGQHELSLKVGKKGEITLKRPTKVGDIVLHPDTYIVQHRTSNGDHFVRFNELIEEEANSMEGNYTYTEKDKAGEIKCRMKPAGAPVEETTIYIAPEKSGDKITKIAIKGEKVVHIF